MSERVRDAVELPPQDCYDLTEGLLERDPYALECLPVHLASALELGKKNQLFLLGHRRASSGRVQSASDLPILAVHASASSLISKVHGEPTFDNDAIWVLRLVRRIEDSRRPSPLRSVKPFQGFRRVRTPGLTFA